MKVCPGKRPGGTAALKYRPVRGFSNCTSMPGRTPAGMTTPTRSVRCARESRSVEEERRAPLLLLPELRGPLLAALPKMRCMGPGR